MCLGSGKETEGGNIKSCEECEHDLKRPRTNNERFFQRIKRKDDMCLKSVIDTQYHQEKRSVVKEIVIWGTETLRRLP